MLRFNYVLFIIELYLYFNDFFGKGLKVSKDVFTSLLDTQVLDDEMGMSTVLSNIMEYEKLHLYYFLHKFSYLNSN